MSCLTNSINYIGHFAVKKIAVGESHSYLLGILREVSARVSSGWAVA